MYYVPPPVLIDKSALKDGILQWTDLPQADYYEVEKSPSKITFWSIYSNYTGDRIYSGPHTILTAINGEWYHVRALVEENGKVIDKSDWSPFLSYTPQVGYIKAQWPMRFYQYYGSYEDDYHEIKFHGLNLGNYLLIEPWMTGITVGDPTRTEDDWNIREKLAERFGEEEAERLIGIYQDAYLQAIDFDNILQGLKANLVRLPIYYRAIRDIDEATGEWKPGSDFNFAQVDRIVDFCADRDIYVLLDLHGAPGAQNKEFHSGRTSAASPSEGFYHKLFDPNNDIYRQRTIELWEAFAEHYKDDTTVMGYDLLNEPSGAVDAFYYPNKQDGYTALWDFYNQLYLAIRQIDPHHVILMEAIPSDKDWDTLPNPADYNWTNVAYEFHYYGFKFNSAGEIDGILDLEQQEKYLVSGDDPDCALYPDDDKFCGKVFYNKKYEYRVPVLIGEFSGFHDSKIWDLYRQTFGDQNWSNTMWSYKHHTPGEEWGVYTHRLYDEEDPNVGVDDIPTLERKFAKYDTFLHHAPNVSLSKLVEIHNPITIDIIWTDIEGAVTASSTLTKTAPTGWGNAGAVSAKSIRGDGRVSFSPDINDTSRMCGLSYSNTDNEPTTIDYAIFFKSFPKEATIFENGVNRPLPYIEPYSATYGGPFYIERKGRTITYKHGSNVLYTSTIPSTGKLFVDCAIYHTGGIIKDTKIEEEIPLVPEAVEDLNAQVHDQEIELSWSEPAASEILEYEIQYNTVASGNYDLRFHDDAIPGATISGLPTAVEYQFRVVARNVMGDGPGSNSVVATVPEVLETDIVWTDIVGATASGGTLTKTASTGWGNGGAASIVSFSGDGGVKFTAVETNTSRMCGLSNSNTDAHYTTINYAIYLSYVGNEVYVYENGTSRGYKTSYTSGDQFSVERIGTIIQYKKNGVVFYTSTTPSSGVLLADCAISQTGGTIADAKIMRTVLGAPNAITDLRAQSGDQKITLSWTAPVDNGSPITEYEVQYSSEYQGDYRYTYLDDAFPGATISGLQNGGRYIFRVVARNAIGTSPASNTVTERPWIIVERDVVWTDIVGATASGNTLTKTAGAGWGNGGAASQQETLSFSSRLQFTADEIYTSRACGLSYSNQDASLATIDFAIYLNGPEVHVWEGGVDRGLKTTYASGDEFYIERIYETVRYVKNGMEFYTSTQQTKGDYVKADCAIYDTGGTIANAKLISLIQYLQPPNGVTNFVGYGRDQEVRLNWSKAVDNGFPITAYIIHYNTVVSGNFDLTYVDDAIPGATINGLTNGVEYQFRVQARNEIGDGSLSISRKGNPRRRPL